MGGGAESDESNYAADDDVGDGVVGVEDDDEDPDDGFDQSHG